MLGGDLGKLLAHGLKSLYPLKKIEIRRSEVLGTIEVTTSSDPASEAVAGPDVVAPAMAEATSDAPADA